MNKTQLAKIVAASTEITNAKAEKIIDVIIDQIRRETKTMGSVTIRGFGKFYLSNSPEKIGRNFKTGEQVVIPPKQVIKFKAAR